MRSQTVKMLEGLKNIVRDNYFKVKNLAHFMTVYSDDYEKDPILIIQMGLAIALDKPIFLLVDQNFALPENLKRLATRIEYCDCKDLESIKNASLKLTHPN